MLCKHKDISMRHLRPCVYNLFGRAYMNIFYRYEENRVKPRTWVYQYYYLPPYSNYPNETGLYTGT